MQRLKLGLLSKPLIDWKNVYHRKTETYTNKLNVLHSDDFI